MYIIPPEDVTKFQGRAVGVVAGATRAFGRRTQGVWGAGPQRLLSFETPSD